MQDAVTLMAHPSAGYRGDADVSAGQISTCLLGDDPHQVHGESVSWAMQASQLRGLTNPNQTAG